MPRLIPITKLLITPYTIKRHTIQLMLPINIQRPTRPLLPTNLTLGAFDVDAVDAAVAVDFVAFLALHWLEYDIFTVGAFEFLVGFGDGGGEGEARHFAD